MGRRTVIEAADLHELVVIYDHLVHGRSTRADIRAVGRIRSKYELPEREENEKYDEYLLRLIRKMREEHHGTVRS